MMADFRRLTAEMIEAALSAHESAILTDKDISDETEYFLNLVGTSDRLKTEISDSVALITEPESDECNRRFRIALVCDIFFWAGWHGRGAIDHQDRLREITGT